MSTDWFFIIVIICLGFGLAGFLVFVYVLYEWLFGSKTNKTDKFNCSKEKKESIEEESLK